jgi:S1-C subfamily serine protease
VVASSALHDLVILKIQGKPLPTFRLGTNKLIPEGRDIAFTGFPIGAVLGLYPATHTGIIASQTPIATPAPSAKQLNLASLKRLRNPYIVYQLDATAYPGNSGSPMYDPRSGLVYGIINKVFVKQSKENVLSKPSAISYAIPVKYLNKLVNQLTN